MSLFYIPSRHDKCCNCCAYDAIGVCSIQCILSVKKISLLYWSLHSISNIRYISLESS